MIGEIFTPSGQTTVFFWHSFFADVFQCYLPSFVLDNNQTVQYRTNLSPVFCTQTHAMRQTPPTAFTIDQDGSVVWTDPRKFPTHGELCRFVSTHRRSIKRLTIAISNPPSFFSSTTTSSSPSPDPPSSPSAIPDTGPIDFSDQRLRLPALQHLLLDCVDISKLTLTSTNVPVLSELHLTNVPYPSSSSSPDNLSLFLRLPQLVRFSAEHVQANFFHPGDDFGLTLSYSPLVESVITYKFRFLEGDNLMILPKCKEMVLHRSECTERVEIVQAPCLKELSVQAAYDLQHVRVWDLNRDVTVQDLETFGRRRAELRRRCEQRWTEWFEKWEDGTFKVKDAIEMNLVELDNVKRPTRSTMTTGGGDNGNNNNNNNGGVDILDFFDEDEDDDDDDSDDSMDDNDRTSANTRRGRYQMNTQTLLEQRFCMRPGSKMYGLLRRYAAEQVEEEDKQDRDMAWTGLLRDTASRRVTVERRLLAKCVVKCANMQMSQSTREHLRGNERLRVATRMEDDGTPVFVDGWEEDMDSMGLF